VKPKLYLETTIPSYLTSLPSKDVVVAGHQSTTRRWWERRKDKFDVYISQFVINEAARGDVEAASKRLEAIAGFPELEIDEDVIALADRLLANGGIPEKAKADALHVAVASVNEMDYLMTWNCTHIANAEVALGIRLIVDKYGYTCPIICTPEELMGDDYVG
jgi:predicted nucleic acid-binding protein